MKCSTDCPFREAVFLGVSVAEVCSVTLLVAVLTWAVIRPFGWPEAVVAVPAAVIVVGVGALSVADARGELAELAPVIAFLAVLVLALVRRRGAVRVVRGVVVSGGQGQPASLLVAVFVVAAVVTAVFSLDATVVLLTPVVFATAARLGVRARPHILACTQLSNTGSFTGAQVVRYRACRVVPKWSQHQAAASRRTRLVRR